MRRIAGSVRVRLTLAVTLIFGVFLSAAAFGLLRQLEAALLDDVQVRNDTVTQALSRLLEAGEFQSAGDGSTQALLDTLAGSQRRIVEEGITESYIFVTGPGDQTPTERGLLRRLQEKVHQNVVPLFGRTLPDSIDQDHFAISRLTMATPNGRIVLSVASPLDGIHRTVGQVRRGLLFVVPTLIACVGALIWFMTGRTLKPVEAIAARAEEIGGSTLNERVPVPPTDDEVARLARTVNGMLDRLEQSAQRQKRFVADASHELRSPVASIRLQVETALLGGEATDWEQVAATVLAEDQRLADLVSDLLAMARLEEGVRHPIGEVDLDELIFEQASQVTPIPVDRSRVGAGRVEGVASELESVVRNLLDNATRHGRTQVRVSLGTVAADGEAPMVRFVVEDDGPGIAASQRGRVFERFARLEEGRERDAGGAGLGLALTLRIVEAHGGSIRVDSSELGGAAFIVDLPAVV